MYTLYLLKTHLNTVFFLKSLGESPVLLLNSRLKLLLSEKPQILTISQTLAVVFSEQGFCFCNTQCF